MLDGASSNSSEHEDGTREPFLGPIIHDAGDWDPESCRQTRSGFFKGINFAAIGTHCAIALVYLIVITFTTSWVNTRTGDTVLCDASTKSGPKVVEIYSPAEEAIEYQLIDFPLRDFYHDNPFVGDPRPEHDEAWRKLLRNMNVRFTAEEMEKVNLTSLKLKDGSGYVGSFTAYHEIHCVHWVRKWMHREHYWPYLQGEALRERKVHIEHCLENLRLNAMCRGSRSVSTFEWMGAFPRPTFEQPHKCINWEKFDAWNAERRVDLFDVDALEGRPPVSPEEEADVEIRLGSKPKDDPEASGGHKE